MAGRIPRAFIEDLLARVDILDVVGARVKLKKAGKNYQACCPFHNEKTPSFTVAADKQFYHCFGCGAHGNAISFVMEYDGLDFVETIEELASGLGLEVPREQGDSPNHETPSVSPTLYQLIDEVARFYQQQLRQHPNKDRAIDYLKNRGLSGETVAKFGIGYAPAGWDNLKRRFGINNERIAQLTDLGLLVQREDGKCYDVFRDRIMFPITDQRGRVIGFGGRVLDNGEPKYLNSPETPLFHKGKELYNFALQRKQRPEQVVVVEGYMDVVALGEAGIDNAVAALGTATSSDHFHKLFRLSKDIVCCYDGDNAGREAAWRALNSALPYLYDGCRLQFVFLPDGEDPDSLVKQQGVVAWQNQLQQAQSAIDFMLRRVTVDLDLRQVEGQAALAERLRPLLARIPADSSYRQLTIEALSNRLINKDPSRIEKLLLSAPALNSGKNERPRSQQHTPLRLAIALLVQQPELAMQLPPASALSSLAQIKGCDLLLSLIDCLQQQTLNTAQLIERYRDSQYASALQKLAIYQHGIADELQSTALFEQLDALVSQQLQQEYEQLLALERQQGLNPQQQQQLLQLLQLMSRSKN